VINLVGSVLTIYLPDAEVGNSEGPELVQTFARTASGVGYSYDKAVAIRRMRLTWANLTQAERDDLEDFFVNDAVATQNTWTLQDVRRGLQWTARFIITRLDFSEPARDMQADLYGAHWAVTVDLSVHDERAYPGS